MDHSGHDITYIPDSVNHYTHRGLVLMFILSSALIHVSNSADAQQSDVLKCKPTKVERAPLKLLQTDLTYNIDWIFQIVVNNRDYRATDKHWRALTLTKTDC